MVTQRTRGKKGEGHETDTIGETNSAEDAGNRRSTPDSEAHAVRQITAKGEWKGQGVISSSSSFNSSRHVDNSIDSPKLLWKANTSAATARLPGTVLSWLDL